MKIIILIELIIAVIGFYIFYRKSFVGPGFLLSLALLGSFAIILINSDNWRVVIYPEFAECITVALISWLLGSTIMRYCLKSAGFLNKCSSGDSRIIQRLNSRYPYMLILCISVFFTFLYLLTKVGSVGLSGIFNIKKLLHALYEENISDSGGNFFKTQILEIVTAVGYISVYRLLVDKVLLKKKHTTLLTVIPIILQLLCILVSTDRNKLIRLFLFLLVLYAMFFTAKPRGNILVLFHFGEDKKINSKLIIRVLIIAVTFGILFFVFGALKGYKSDFVKSISIYAGSGLYNFNLFIHKYSGSYLYGKETFSQLQNTLSYFGIMEQSTIPRYYDFLLIVSPKGYIYHSNIYSAFYPYYRDFGILGVGLFVTLISAFYELFYNNIIKHKYGFAWVLYAALIYPIIYVPIAEQLFKRFHLGLIYEITWLALFYFLIYAKDGLWRIRHCR